MTENVTRDTGTPIDRFNHLIWANFRLIQVIDVLSEVIKCRAAAVISHVVQVIAQNFSGHILCFSLNAFTFLTRFHLDFIENPKFDWQALSLAMMMDLLHSSALLAASEAHVFQALERFLAKYKKEDPLSEKKLLSLFETVRFEKLDYSTLEAALNHPLVPKSLLSHALMLKLAKFEKPNSDASVAQAQKSPPANKFRRPSYGRLLQYSTDFVRSFSLFSTKVCLILPLLLYRTTKVYCTILGLKLIVPHGKIQCSPSLELQSNSQALKRANRTLFSIETLRKFGLRTFHLHGSK